MLPILYYINYRWTKVSTIKNDWKNQLTECIIKKEKKFNIKAYNLSAKKIKQKWLFNYSWSKIEKQFRKT